MEPLPETVRAIEDFGPFVIEDEDLSVELVEKATRVQAIVPTCVGLSVASAQDQATFTVIATAEEIALMDAVQYLAGGPCVKAVEVNEVVTYEEADVLDEAEWQLFAQATAAASVASTLTLPLIDAGRVVGSVNLYASTPHAFDGHHEEVADIFGGWAVGAVTNADLSFSTRKLAEQAPVELREDVDISVAAGILASEDDVDPDIGRQMLTRAAALAGVTEPQLARTLIDLRNASDVD